MNGIWVWYEEEKELTFETLEEALKYAENRTEEEGGKATVCNNWEEYCWYAEGQRYDDWTEMYNENTELFE